MKASSITVLKITVFVLFAALVFLTAYAVIRHFEHRVDSDPAGEDTAARMNFRIPDRILDGVTYAYDPDITLCLFLGVDTSGVTTEKDYYLTGGQADVLFLLAVDDREKEIRILQLDRDTMCDVRTFGIYGDTGDTISAQLALSYAYGNGGTASANNTLRSVKGILSLPVTSYAAVMMDGIAAIASQCRGLTVNMPSDCTWLDPAYTEGATVTLDGDHTVRFIRARMETYEGTNRDRMERHRAILPAMLEALSAKVLPDADTTEALL